MPRDPLPIDAALPALLAALAESGAAVLQAPTGAGKTTRVPPALLPTAPGLVWLVEPRRVAARAAARRMATEDGSPLGERFGYHVRFDRRAGRATRVVALTPGIALRMLHGDPYLEGVSTVVFDEFHERGLESDLLLGLVRTLRQAVRPDLKVVVMSATLDPQPIADYLGPCRVVASEGRAFPVEIRYHAPPRDTPLPRVVAEAVRLMLAETPGDLLVFLPGVREIFAARAELEPLAAERNLALVPLYGDLPGEEQDRALSRGVTRKVVLATNVAEASVTVEGVTGVIDTGTARQLEFDPALGMDRLNLAPISRAAADQRAGRAGRTQPGVALRLGDPRTHQARAAHTEPEVRRVDLASAVLQLYSLGERGLASFPWLDEPRPESLAQAAGVLDALGATENDRLTPLGEALTQLPAPPRVGCLLLEAHRLGVAAKGCLAAALLTERDPFAPEARGVPAPTAASDLAERVSAMERFRQSGRLTTPLGPLSRGGAEAVLRAADQFARLLDGDAPPAGDPDEALLRAVLAAYPDRVARRRAANDPRALLVGGRGVRLAPSSGVREEALFACLDVDAGGTESPVRMASGVRRDWLPAHAVTARHEVRFDPDAEKLVARKVTRYFDLTLDETPGHFPDDGTAAEALAAAALASPERVLPADDTAAGQLLVRLKCLAAWLPDAAVPAVGPDMLRELLTRLAAGRKSFAELRAAPWLSELHNALGYDGLKFADREAPATLVVPSGSSIGLTYEAGRPPVLAVKIQELFGLAQTPRVAAGRVKVLLHLLAPSGRSHQVTDDLPSFWRNGYPVARKELRGRYPKHSWPDDPLAAEPTRGVRRRPAG